MAKALLLAAGFVTVGVLLFWAMFRPVPTCICNKPDCGGGCWSE